MSGLRVGNADRENASTQLSEHYAEGRLDEEEYAERLDAVWSARTHEDLALIFHDLPRRAPAPAPVAVRPTRRGGPPVLLLVGLLAALAFTVGVLAHVPWWLFLIAGVVLLKHRGGCGRR